MKLGIGTYAYMWSIGFQFGDRAASPEHPMSAMALLERAHALGLHLVQYGPNLPLSTLSEPELDALASQARAWDIELEAGTRGLETPHLLEQLGLAGHIGAKLLRTVPEVGGQTPDGKEVTALLKAIAPELARHGIKLGLENGKIPAHELRSAIDAAQHPAAASDSPMVGVVLDTINSLAIPEGWRYVAEVLAPLTICLHMKDVVIKRAWHMMGFICEGTPAGQGMIDLPWLLKTLDRAGASYNVILEVWPPEQATLAETIALEDRWVRESIGYLREYIPR